jgi:hypothetical protein
MEKPCLKWASRCYNRQVIRYPDGSDVTGIVRQEALLRSSAVIASPCSESIGGSTVCEAGTARESIAAYEAIIPRIRCRAGACSCTTDGLHNGCTANNVVLAILRYGLLITRRANEGWR